MSAGHRMIRASGSTAPAVNLVRAQAMLPGVYLEDLCFDAQQAAEKAIKAVLIARGAIIPITSIDSSRVAMTDVSPSSRPSLMPAPRTPLIGREREVAAVRCPVVPAGRAPGHPDRPRRRGQDPARRFFRGGGAAGGDAFGDGACFVDLAPVRDPAFVLSAVAQALGVREAPTDRWRSS